MRRAGLLAVGLIVLAASPTYPQSRMRSGQGPVKEIVVTARRLVRLEQWIKATEHHRPGEADDPATLIGSWPNDQLQELWADVSTLLLTMRDPRSNRSSFVVRLMGRRPVSQFYPPREIRRLRELGCAAGGNLDHPACVELRVGASLDTDLVKLAARVVADRFRGDDNHVVRRGALLHTDIATLNLAKAATSPVSQAQFMYPERVRVEIADGQGLDVGLMGIHWDIAEEILDHVQPPGTSRVNPAGDPMVLQWYRTTSRWMQLHADYDIRHLERGRQLFPNDPDLLFLAGCQHETDASPGIQSSMRAAVIPPGFSIDIGSSHGELRRAEGFFRDVIARVPWHGEARLRLGRVLGLLDRHADAVEQLTTSIEQLTDRPLQYYAQLFLGAAQEALRKYDEAREAYERASGLYPDAQSPHLALSQLARRRGDRAAALRAIERLFALPSDAFDRDDPIWTYHAAQARTGDDDLEALRKPFITEERP